jgi:hypothetical protein
MPTAPLAAVVQVAADPTTGALPVALITSAYLARVSGPVTFVLEGIDRATVERMLGAVFEDSLDVSGIRYCAPSDLPALIRQLGPPRVAVARTEAFQELLAELDLQPVPETQALAALADLAEGLAQGPERISSRAAAAASDAPGGHTSA